MSKRGALKSIVVLCIQTSIALRQLTFADTVFCTWPPAWHKYSLTDAQQWSLNAPLMLRHFSTSGDLWCVHTSIVVHWPTSFNIARCHPSSLSDATATRLGIAGHRSSSIVNRCTAMKSDQTSIVLHRPTSVDASLLWDYPCYAHKHSQRAKLLWTTSIGRHWPMHSDEVWMHHNGAFRLHRCAS